MKTLNVTYADGEDASGMATMLGGLLEDNVRDYKGRAGVSRFARGDVVLTAADRDISVTLSFRGDEVVVANGASEGAAVLAGPWLEMAKLCSGQVNPFKAMARRELKIEPHGRLDTVAAAGFVLSVPPSFYGDEEAIRRRRIQVGVAVAATIGVAVTIAYVRRRRRRAA
ncbi:MAG: hypothetical protein U0U69_07650 [Acidimicrobiia bacterium]